MKTGWQFIGRCAVDSGQIMLIDPCYVITDEKDTPEYQASHKVNYGEILEAWEFDTKPKKTHFEFHMGMIVESGWGDGYYPVYAKFDGSRLVAVKIDFDEEDDEAY
jgi:hypothetical protein